MHQHLHLVHIIGVAGNQRWRAEFIEVSLGEAFYFVEYGSSHISPKTHRYFRAQIRGGYGAGREEQRYNQHKATSLYDVSDIAFSHSVVDDISIQAGQIQIRHGLRQ
jgi:hypothetical protein